LADVNKPLQSAPLGINVASAHPTNPSFKFGVVNCQGVAHAHFSHWSHQKSIPKLPKFPRLVNLDFSTSLPTLDHSTSRAHARTVKMATELTVQSERAFQKQPHSEF
jgi:hypothetical protein